MDDRLILVTGATGYIGGRLVRALSGRRLRLMARRPEYLRGRVPEDAEVVAGDILDPGSLAAALQGVDTAYYLVHSLASGERFQQEDRAGARNFGEAARKAGVRRIVYVGGLGDSAAPLSSHLRSRQETGEILRRPGVPVIEFRASVIIGSGSLSFELIRALVERLPVMICPRWVATPTQPIGIEDMLSYLVAALDLEVRDHRTYEIGCRDVASYGAMMREYARLRGLRRRMISVPFLTPRLSSLWLGLVTPVYARVGRPLVEGLRNPTVVRDRTALADFSIRPLSMTEAIGRALRNEDHECAETAWTDAVCSSATSKAGWGGARFGSRIVEVHTAAVPAEPAAAFQAIRRIGGRTGWYFGNLLWRIRGWLDLLAGGPGLRRGRRDPEFPRVGDHIDFWRVEAYVPDQLLRLRAEMKLPGRAWLEFRVDPTASGAQIRQVATFDPRGLSGLLYWHALYPIHRLMFRGMLNRIAGCAGRAAPTRRQEHPIRAH